MESKRGRIFAVKRGLWMWTSGGDDDAPEIQAEERVTFLCQNLLWALLEERRGALRIWEESLGGGQCQTI